MYSINGREYEWADISLIVGGVPIVGFKAVSYKHAIEKEVLFAKGRKGLSIQRKNETVEGSITFTQTQLDLLKAAALPLGGLLKARFDIVVAYGAETPQVTPMIHTDTVKGAEFTEYEKAMNQGDGSMEIAVPFVALDIIEA
jgi:hypothetical protein